MIDYIKAESAFKEYTKQFDLTDNKIKLKWVHTFGVVTCAEMIATKEKLDNENIQLAKVIALLHDIGRFEQLKQFNSFSDENIDHAKLASHYLFHDSHIRDFVESNEYDAIIKKAIEDHSVFKVEEQVDKTLNLHIKLIRDADKLDNFRVKNIENIETLLDMSMEELSQQKLSDYIFDQLLCKQLILSHTRKTAIDIWASYIAFVFDLNFRSSFKYLLEKDYITKNIERIDYQHLYTKKKMNLIKKFCNEYVVWNSLTK